MKMKVGVLALQGDYAAHAQALRGLGADVLEVRKAKHLEQVSGLVIPGGESSTLLKLIDPHLKEDILQRAGDDLSLLGTCAGCIFLASEVTNPGQDSLALLDISVVRNAYGRQLESFVEPSLHWTDSGKKVLVALSLKSDSLLAELEGVFIRAPKIVRTGEGVQVLASCGSDPVWVRNGKIWATTFHPELSPGPSIVHQAFLDSCSKEAAGTAHSACSIASAPHLDLRLFVAAH